MSASYPNHDLTQIFSFRSLVQSVDTA